MAITLGLISDTHYQDRLFELPQGLSDVFAGISLLLHAGDVGEVSVLDELGRIAPVVAVHGNDEPEYVKAWLPYQQIVSVYGMRILLCHSHYPDPVEERAKRGGPWGPKLARLADLGREVGAGVVVYGHTHVPLIYRYDEVLLINPGALASGNYFSRQVVTSIALLQVTDSGEAYASHVDLATGKSVELPAPNPNEEFGVLAQTYQQSIAEPELLPDLAGLGRIAYEDVRAIVAAVRPLYRRALQQGMVRRSELVAAIRAAGAITANDRAQVLAVLER